MKIAHFNYDTSHSNICSEDDWFGDLFVPLEDCEYSVLLDKWKWWRENMQEEFDKHNPDGDDSYFFSTYLPDIYPQILKALESLAKEKWPSQSDIATLHQIDIFVDWEIVEDVYGEDAYSDNPPWKRHKEFLHRNA